MNKDVTVLFVSIVAIKYLGIHSDKTKLLDKFEKICSVSIKQDLRGRFNWGLGNPGDKKGRGNPLYSGKLPKLKLITSGGGGRS